mmetsp:Transcript_8389/g.21586  ORF Transcript_8389/g.21586 Transcript_8389/m.21586 type:complete len:122 (-) Transcript_8389:99-464(-)
MSAEEVAKAFVQQYYQMFGSNREGMAPLYRDQSSLSFEADGVKRGSQQIMEKLRSLPPCAHNVQSVDVQQSVTPNAILVFCTGQIMIEQGKPLKFTQVFQLVAEAPNQYYLHNDMFRFNYA